VSGADQKFCSSQWGLPRKQGKQGMNTGGWQSKELASTILPVQLRVVTRHKGTIATPVHKAHAGQATLPCCRQS